MKLLALERELASSCDPRWVEFSKAEAKRLWELQQEGFVREAYFDTLEHTAVLVLEADSKADAESLLASLPMVENRIIRFEVIPLAPYDGYARLFERGA